MTPVQKRYSELIFQLRLPYRVFLDDGQYPVRHGEVTWIVSHFTEPGANVPSIGLGAKTQLHLDNHGFSGYSTFFARRPFPKPLSKRAVDELQSSEQRMTLSDAVGAINRLIAWYRVLTNEFWFRPLGTTDVPVYSVSLQPIGEEERERQLFSTNVMMAQGYPYFKREAWYEELLMRVGVGEEPPFPLELINEGRDALERGNLRLAATNFVLSVEALFRALLGEFFPDEVLTRPVEQMMGCYYRRFQEIGTPEDMPIKRKAADRLMRRVWCLRDRLLHGHVVRLEPSEVESARDAAVQLFELWQARPGGRPLPIEGPFAFGHDGEANAHHFPPRDPAELCERAVSRFNAGHLDDAEEAARYALVLDSGCADAKTVLGMVAFRRGDFQSAAEQFKEVLRMCPDRQDVLNDLKATEANMSATKTERTLAEGGTV